MKDEKLWIEYANIQKNSNFFFLFLVYHTLWGIGLYDAEQTQFKKCLFFLVFGKTFKLKLISI
jgi:hypothetical protein